MSHTEELSDPPVRGSGGPTPTPDAKAAWMQRVLGITVRTWGKVEAPRDQIRRDGPKPWARSGATCRSRFNERSAIAGTFELARKTSAASEAATRRHTTMAIGASTHGDRRERPRISQSAEKVLTEGGDGRDQSSWEEWIRVHDDLWDAFATPVIGRRRAGQTKGVAGIPPGPRRGDAGDQFARDRRAAADGEELAGGADRADCSRTRSVP